MKTTTNCPKCDGSRRISAFSHIASGLCFTCGGSGKIDCSKVRTSSRSTVTRLSRAEVIRGIGAVLGCDGVTGYCGESEDDSFRITDEIGYLFFCAPSDVRSRAVAAFGKVVPRRHLADFLARCEAFAATCPAIEERALAAGAIDGRGIAA